MKKTWLSFVITISIITGAAYAAAPETKPKPVRVLDQGQTHTELQTYLHKHRPKFTPPANPDKWIKQAQEMRQRLINEIILRGVPDSWLAEPTQVVWGETIPMDKYTIRKLRYQVVPKLWAGALLYQPASIEGHVPAVLNTNGHVGKPGMSIPYKQIRCINLAKRGILALSLEWVGQGQLRNGYSHNDLAYLDLCGRSSLAVMYLSLKRGLDILCDHQNTDPERIAVTGLSGGGWQTIFISSLDNRVKLMAPNAGYSGLDSRIERRGDIGDLEQNPCDLLTIADYPHLTAIFAPRPALLIYNQYDNCCFQAPHMWASVYNPVLPVYELFGCPEKFCLHVNYHPGTHNYDKDNRQAFYRFLNRHFLTQNQAIDDEIPCDDEVLTQEKLAITYPPDNANFHTLATQAMSDLPKTKNPHPNKKTRRKLIKLLRPDILPIVCEPPLKPTPIPEFVDGVKGQAYRLKKGGNFTIPLVVFSPPNSQPAETTLILADRGRAHIHDIISRELKKQRRVIAADLLFTGESTATAGSPGQWGMMIAAVGKRPLGIHFNQLLILTPWIKDTFGHQPLNIVTKGNVSGLAALVFAARFNESITNIELHNMVKSLKNLLPNKIRQGHAPSLFCFGLLKLLDVPRLIELAEPTKIKFVTAATKP
ncbi:MAG: alpha/beta hydrolase family protein [Planctomycetota bacterium]|jgi:dienelactone hydrolase